MRLEGKVALISGGARGQGATEGQLFVDEGAKVVLADILDVEGEAAAAQIRENGGDASYVHLDVASEDDWQAAIEFTLQTYGRLDILINNAAIYRRTPIVDTDLEEWRQIMEINSTGVFLGTKHAIPAMRRSGRRLHHQHIVHRRACRKCARQRLRSLQGKCTTLHQVHGHSARYGEHPRQLDPSGADRHRDDR